MFAFGISLARVVTSLHSQKGSFAQSSGKHVDSDSVLFGLKLLTRKSESSLEDITSNYTFILLFYFLHPFSVHYNFPQSLGLHSFGCTPCICTSESHVKLSFEFADQQNPRLAYLAY